MVILTPKQEWNFLCKYIKLGPDDCWEWLGSTNKPNGYGKVKLNGKTKLAHRVAWALANGGWPADQVNHHCDNPSCVNPAHLYNGSASENTVDHIQRGHLHTQKKLVPADVICIRASGKSTIELSHQFGVTRNTIQQIIARTRWSHVD